MNPGGHSDDHFEKDLEQVTGAYREIHPDEPPALLDQAVLNQARRAVESKSVRPWNFGWIHAVTTAAVIVLAVGIVLQIPEKQATAPVSRDAIEYRPAEELQTKRELTADELEGNARKQVEKESAGRLESFADEPAAVPLRQDAPADMDSAGAGADERSGFETAAEAEPVTVQSSSAVGANADAGDAEEKARRRQVRLEETREIEATRETEEPQVEALAPIQQSAEIPVPAAPPAVTDEPVEEIVVTGASRVEAEADQAMQDDAAGAARSQDGFSLANGAPLAAAQSGDFNEQAPEDPEAWLQRIRELLDSGDREGFESGLEAFRKAWPDYELPPDLAAESVAGPDG